MLNVTSTFMKYVN